MLAVPAIVWLRWAPISQCMVSLLVIMVAVATGCASFKPGNVEKAGFRERSLHREDAEFRVEVAVPSPREVAQLFDRKLDREGIQPVWLRVENRGDSPAFFLPLVTDAEYFPPLEAAFQYHSIWQPNRNAAMDGFFLTNSMPSRIPPRSVRSGFVFTHHDLGAKQVCIGLVDATDFGRIKRYTFVVEVPGLQTDHPSRSWEEMSEGAPVIECDAVQLRAELEKMPRATTDKSGKKEGDPLNLVLIGTPADLEAMAGRGWNQTERITAGTSWRTVKSFLFGSRYRYSPISSLYYAGQPQDMAFQKARGSVNLRNHLRLWLTPLRYRGKPVWIGQISRDIGVRWTLKTPNLTTHKINANVDETRGYLIQDLTLGQAARSWGFVTGVEAAPLEAPRHNLTGDPYHTDGLRAVIELSAEPVELRDIQFRKWEIPPDRAHGH